MRDAEVQGNASPDPVAEALVDALDKIKREGGKVCASFEICQHPACQSSCAAWMIADEALAAYREAHPIPAVEYLPADLLLSSAAVTAAHDLMKGRGIRAGRTAVADMLAAAFRAARVAHPRPSLPGPAARCSKCGDTGWCCAGQPDPHRCRCGAVPADQLARGGNDVSEIQPPVFVSGGKRLNFDRRGEYDGSLGPDFLGTGKDESCVPSCSWEELCALADLVVKHPAFRLPEPTDYYPPTIEDEDA